MPSIFDDDLTVRGTLTASTISLGAGDVTNAAVSATADIAATKVRHQFPITYATDTGSAVAAAERVLHIARGDGDIAAFEVVCETPPTGGDLAFTVDIHKGNASTGYATILSAVVTMNSSDVARTIDTGTLSTTTYSDGDQFKVVVAVEIAAGAEILCLGFTVFEQQAPCATAQLQNWTVGFFGQVKN